MNIKYDVTGDTRKALVRAIGQELTAPMKYLGAPTFAFEVSGYRIDKNGTVTGADNCGLVANLQGLHDFKPVSAEYENSLSENEGASAHGIHESGDSDRLVIEVPMDGFTEDTIANLRKLVDSKAALIEKAVGADSLPIEQTEATLGFSWFPFDASGEQVSAYTKFVSALCEMAKTQHRVSAKQKDVANEKYAFRCFLLRLGFIGPEYKEARKVLLKNLSGDAAFKSKGETA